jgi:cell division septum initiation protein DivIVA
MAERITLKQALARIQQLEKENAELREELEYYKKRKASGRQKHNAKWMAVYNDFVISYEKGMTLEAIAEKNNISKRTVYRYKKYYDLLSGSED